VLYIKSKNKSNRYGIERRKSQIMESGCRLFVMGSECPCCQVIRKLKLPYEDLEQQYIRMVFNVLARNVDDHSKNFAFCMQKDGSWKLSPAYDLTFSVDLAAPAYVNRHSLSVNGKYEQITREDLEIIGHNNDIQNYKSLIDKVANAISGFDTYARDEKLNPGLIDDIRKEFPE